MLKFEEIFMQIIFIQTQEKRWGPVTSKMRNVISAGFKKKVFWTSHPPAYLKRHSLAWLVSCYCISEDVNLVHLVRKQFLMTYQRKFLIHIETILLLSSSFSRMIYSTAWKASPKKETYEKKKFKDKSLLLEASFLQSFHQ